MTSDENLINKALWRERKTEQPPKAGVSKPKAKKPAPEKTVIKETKQSMSDAKKDVTVQSFDPFTPGPKTPGDYGTFVVDNQGHVNWK